MCFARTLGFTKDFPHWSHKDYNSNYILYDKNYGNYLFRDLLSNIFLPFFLSFILYLEIFKFF